MPKIRLTSDVLKQKSGEVTQCMEEQQEIIRKVAQVISDIVAEWEGEAQKAFIQKFDEARPVYEKFAPDLSNFANFLTNYAETMEYVDVGGREDMLSR
ncbi:MAG: WXG100 family type VII secretion target [Synergistaceae bacterium]|nr:WXG100 family type VII secretion target [Synergistaceae bacterium]MBQ9905064.1 WXG100 family type VII secretion target [Synergistaceae bacterium]